MGMEFIKWEGAKWKDSLSGRDRKWEGNSLSGRDRKWEGNSLNGRCITVHVSGRGIEWKEL